MNISNQGGVYKITNRINKKIYIGSTSDLNKRKRVHFNTLNKNTHRNKHLQNSFNKYGEENFTFEVIEVCDKTYLLEREQYYIDLFNSYNPKIGYNIVSKAGNMLGFRHSEETKKKISNANSGENNYMFGKTHTIEVRQKISELAKGNKNCVGFKHTKQSRENMSKGAKGKVLSDETRQKISLKNKGKKRSKETKLKISNYQRNKSVSEETRKKLSLAQTGNGTKLTEIDVINILYLLSKGVRQCDLIMIYNISSSHISNIYHGKVWKHIKLENYLDQDGNMKSILY